jgi:hypothetical protein
MLVLVGTLAVGAVAVAVYAQSSLVPAIRRSVGAVSSSATEQVRPQLTRLQVDLFELKCTREELLKLDLMELGKGKDGPMKASVQEVLERLKQIGDASLAVRYDNFVDLVAGTRMATGKSVPTITNTSLSGSGIVVPTVQYDAVGFTLELKGAWLDQSEPTMANIDLKVESSSLSPEGVPVGFVGNVANLKLPVYDQFVSDQRIVARQGLPVLLACNDMSKVPPSDGKVPMLIARLVATRLIE